jgi:hypothetical protein
MCKTLCDEDILDLGAATELTLGEPELWAFENVLIEDFRD